MAPSAECVLIGTGSISELLCRGGEGSVLSDGEPMYLGSPGYVLRVLLDLACSRLRSFWVI